MLADYLIVFRNTTERLLVVLLGIAPLFLVTIRSWSNAILIIGFIISSILLIGSKKTVQLSHQPDFGLRVLLLMAFALPMCSIALSSGLRGVHTWSEYDSASRFFVALVVFMFAISRTINIAQIIQYTVPASLIIDLLHQYYFHQPRLWGPERMSTYFSDPLTFGYTSLTLGLISLASIHLLAKDAKSIVALKLTGACVGFYLSIMSGSRTGWLAIPCIILFWFQVHARESNNKRKYLASFGFLVMLLVGIYFYSSTVHQRIDLALQEVVDYSWTGLAPETSIGLRITFLRIGWDIFWNHPVTGYGELHAAGMLFPEQVYRYATPETIGFMMSSGFHNEIVNQAVHYGIFGFISSVLLFAGPMFIFMRKIHSNCTIQRGNALIGVIFTTCFLLSSFSTEVFDLKYTASFYALMVALLCASCLSKHSSGTN